MTIGTSTSRVSFACDGVTKVFPVPLQAYAAADFTVILTAPVSAGGGEATLTLNSDYSLATSGTLAPTAWTLTTLAAAAYLTGYTLQVLIDPDVTQQTQFVQGQPFPSLAVQTAFDRITQMVLRLQDEVSRTIRAPDGDVNPLMLLPVTSQRLNQTLITDGNGNISTGVLNAQVITTALLAPFLGLGITAAETAALVTPANYAYPPGDARRYGVVGDGIADDRLAIQNAIKVAQVFGGNLYIPAGKYLIVGVAGGDAQNNGIVVPYTNVFGYQKQVRIFGDAQGTELLAGSNNMTVIRWSDSNCALRDIAIDGNSKTSVTGISLIGSNTADAALAEHIDWNLFEKLSINGCTEGITLQSPSAGGCYYNTFLGCRLYNNTRHIQIQDNAVKGGANRNTFITCSMNGGNAGVTIDGTDTTRLIACGFENINTGVSPRGTPTGIYLNNVGTLHALGSNDTNIIGCTFENCTQDLDCNNFRTYIVGGNCGSIDPVVGSATPNLWIGGDSTFIFREAQFGAVASDGLVVNDRLGNITTYACSAVLTSANSAGSFPFQNDGSLILKSRTATTSGVSCFSGTPSTERWRADGNGHYLFVNADVAFTQSAGTAAITNGQTITTAGTVLARINPGSAVTGIILQAGTQPGQKCVVVNENSTNSATFAVAGTSNVADGVSSVVPNLRSVSFYWDSVQSLWFRS